MRSFGQGLSKRLSLALATLLWTAWWALRGKREEKKKEDDKDKRRRKRADEEDSRRIEEIERKVVERVNAALRQFEDVLITIGTYRRVKERAATSKELSGIYANKQGGHGFYQVGIIPTR